MRSLSLALLVPVVLASACVLTINDPVDTAGGSSSEGEGTQNGTGADTGADTGTTADQPTTSASSDTDPATTTTDPSAGSTSTTGDPGTTTADPSTTGASDPDEAATQLCVDTINMYRATLGLPALARWKDAEDCSDAECVSDGMTGVAHGAFGMCGEFAQNECPGWPGAPADMITGCLELMWAEGPGDDFNKHGHYINMSNPAYTKVACGFAPGMGGIWAVQNFQ